MDEACSSVRVQLDSRPEEMDTMERQRLRLLVSQSVMGCTAGESVMHVV